MERDINIDALKGFAIVLVVVGHSSQIHKSPGLAFSIIYTFHMALLMFAAGMVINSGSIAGRAKQLLLPYACWFFLLPLTLKSSVKGISSELWFLPVLFIYVVLLSLVRRAQPRARAWISCAVLWILLTLVGELLLKIPGMTWHNATRLSYFWLFFCGGYLIRKRWPEITRWRIPKPYLSISLVAFAGLIVLFERPLAGGAHIVNLWRVGLPQNAIKFGSAYLGAIFGILMSLTLIKLLPRKTLMVLAVIGWYSLDIYLMHVIFIQLTGILWLAVILGVLGPIIAGSLIRKIPVARTALLGGRGKSCPWLQRGHPVLNPRPLPVEVESRA